MVLKKYDKHALAKVKSERPFAKRLFSHTIIIILLLSSILIISFNVAAESYKVEVKWSNPADGTADVTPGQWETYTVTVKNIGENFGEDINLTAVFTDPNKEAQGWSVSPAFLQFNLGNNVEVTKIVKIRPPSNASFEDDAQVYVKAEVVGHVSEQGGTSQVTLYANVLHVYGVANTIKNNDNIHNVSDGSYTVFTLNITNTGNGDDDFDLSYSGLPSGWPVPSFSTDTVIGLGSQNTQTVTFQVNVPLNAKSTSYTISTIATSIGNPSKSSSASVTVQVIAKYKVSIDASPSQSSGVPGEQKDYLITIRNKSNIEEEFSISTTVIEGPSWSESISIGSNPILEYQENLTFTLSVTIGNDANDNDFNRVKVTVTSQSNPTVNASVICRTNVNQIYGIQVSSPTKKSVDPGDTTWFIVNVRNTGNGIDTINIETSGAFGGGTSNETILPDMQPDEIRSINVTVNVGDDAPAGIQEITVTGTSDTNPATTDYGTIQVDVNERFEVSVVPNGPSYMSGYPGGSTVVYEIRVKNDGTGIDDVLLDLEGQKPTWATLSLPVVNDLSPGAYKIVFVNVTIPSGEKVNEWYINVTGESNGDSTQTSMVALRLKVEQVYNVSLSAPSNSKSIPADSSTTYTITVRNRGSGYDDFTMEPWAENPIAATWPSIDIPTFGLQSGKSINISLTVDVPLGTNPGSYNIWVNVTSENSSSVKRSLRTITQVTQTYSVLIATGSEDSGESPPDSVISYEIEVRNTGSGTDSFVIEKIGEPESNHQDWATLSENFIENLGPGQAFSLTVNIEIPEDVGGDTEDHLLIRIYSNNDTASPPAHAYVWLNTTITPERDAELTPHQDIFYREPGDEIVVTLQLTNTGTASDTFTVEDVTEAPYDTWGVVKLPATVTLNPVGTAGNTTYMTYTITVDDTVTREESPIKLNLVVKSTGANDDIVEDINITVHINQTFAVKISTTQNEQTGDPGDTLVFFIKIKNEGNDNDTFSLTHSGTGDLGQWQFSEVTLIPKESITINYTVEIDEDHDTTDIVIILNASSDSDETDSTYKILQLIVHVEPRYEVKLGQNGGDRKDGKAGITTEFNLTVKNEGTDIDTFELTVVAPAGFQVTLSTTSIEVESVVNDPLNSTKWALIWVDLRVDPPVPVGEYLIVVNATSSQDETAYDEFTFYVDVKATRGVTLFSPTASVQVDAGDNAVFPGIQVTNDGNDDDSFSFFITGLQVGWTTSPLSPLNNIPPDGTSTFDLTVYTTDQTVAGIYTFNLTARSIGDPSVEERTMLTVEVNQVYEVELPSVSSKTVDVGETVSYIISVKNTGNGIDNIELTLTGVDAQWGNLYYSPTENGQTIHVSPPSGGSLTVYFNVTPPEDYWDTETGDIIITIEATSLDDPGGTPASDSVQITTKVNDVYEFRVSGSGSGSGIPGGDLVTFSLTINNDGSTSDSFNLKVLEIRTNTGGTISYWESENTNPFSVNPVSVAKGGQQTIDVDIEIPFPDSLEEVPPGDYIIEVEIKSTGDPDIIQTVNYTVKVKQLYAAEIVNTITSQNVDVGNFVTYTIQVKNIGNRVDNISIEVEDDGIITGDQTSWTNVTYNNIDITSINLDAGDAAWITFKVRIPDRTEPGYPSTDPLSVTFHIIVAPSKPDEPGAVKEEVDIKTNINPIYEFDPSPIPKQAGEPGDTVEFSLRIKNTGTGSDTYTPELVWLENWEQYQSPPQFDPEVLSLGPGQTGTITIFFTIPSDNDVALAGEYTNEVIISSDNTDEQTFQFTVEVEEVYGLELTDPATLNKAVTVGNAVTYQFKIKNTGNSQDTYVLDKIDEDPSSTGGGDQSSWASFALASDPGTDITSVILGAEASETVIFTIDVPPQSDPNFVELTNALEMTVVITSEGGTNLDDEFTTTTTVDPIYAFELTTTDDQKEGEPGDSVTFTLQVRNSGTSSDSYKFRVTSIDESIFPGTVDPNDISNLNVDSFGTTTASFEINDDKSKALTGSYDIEITATSSSDAGVTEIITLTIDITPLAAVEITPSSQTDNGEPEEEIDYSLQIRNKGNAEDTFELTLSGTNKDWGEILDSNENPITEVTLSATTLPGSFVNIIVRVTIPGTGETKADQTYPITIKAASRNTENVYDEAQVSTRVEDFVDLELEYSGGGTPEKTYDPNKKSPKFSLRVTNNGNQDESSVEIRVDDIDAEWDYTPKTLPDTLDPGGSTTFSLEFTIPTDAPEDEYNMQVVVVSSVDSAEESDPVTITVTVVKPDLVISSGDISGLEEESELKKKIGSQVTILVTVRNEGTSIAESVQVKLYEGSSVKGTTSISSLNPDGNETVTFRWKVVAEEVELKIEAIPLEESNEGNNAEEIYLDLRPNFEFEGEKINFSDPSPNAKDKITITAFISNDGGDAEDITVTFFYGGKSIGSDDIDIAYGDTGEATVEWDVPDKAGDSLTVEVEVDHPDAQRTEKTSKSVKVAKPEATGAAALFTEAGMIGMGIGLAIGAILFLLIGLAVGRRAGGKGPQGMAAGGPSFAAYEKQMAEGAEKKAPKGPVPFERTGEEGAPPAAAPAAAPAAGPAEEEAAKPKEVARVRCPKCGKVTEVTSTQRPLQIPCECGTTLMLKK